MIRKVLCIGIGFIMLISCDNKTAQEYLDEAKISKETYEYDDALESLQKCIEKDSAMADAYLMMSEIYHTRTDYPKEVEYLDAYAKNGGDKTDYYERKVTLYWTYLSNADSAIINSLALLGYTDDSCEVMNNLAYFYYANGLYDEALKCLREPVAAKCMSQENSAIFVELTMAFKQYSNTKHKFSLNYPKEWKINEVAKSDMFFVEYLENTTGVNFNLTVGSDQDAGLDAWKNMIYNDLVTNNVEILENKTITVNSQDCLFISGKHVNGEYAIIMNHYVLLKNGHAYMINFTSPAPIYFLYKKVEQKIINSIKIE